VNVNIVSRVGVEEVRRGAARRERRPGNGRVRSVECRASIKARKCTMHSWRPRTTAYRVGTVEERIAVVERPGYKPAKVSGVVDDGDLLARLTILPGRSAAGTAGVSIPVHSVPQDGTYRLRRRTRRPISDSKKSLGTDQSTLVGPNGFSWVQCRSCIHGTNDEHCIDAGEGGRDSQMLESLENTPRRWTWTGAMSVDMWRDHLSQYLIPIVRLEDLSTKTELNRRPSMSCLPRRV
jgi:hypothetical protein